MFENNRDLADRLAARSDEIRALMSGVAGFRAYHLVRSNDGAASVTVCDDQAVTEESNRLAASWLKENMPDAVPVAPQVTAGKVVVDF